jgi:hypothetical protein
MAEEKLHPIPPRDPVTGGELVITELSNPESGVTIRGRFAVPRYSRLDAEQAKFLETFLRCRGMLNSVERELGMSYPTVRARLDALLEALEFAPIREENGARKEKASDRRQKILDQLERGEITPAEAKARLRGGH